LWDGSLDTSGYTSVPWTVTVTNTAPFFNIPILPNVTIKMNFIGLYPVSSMIQDNEGHNSFLTYKKYTATGTLLASSAPTIPFVSL
jgi:hypothetical protein